MGYDLHITRKEFWADDEGPETGLEEWVALVEADPAIQSDDENPGPHNYVFRYGQNACPLWWDDDLGEIYTKNPDPPVIAKLVQIAALLGAQVMGDDGEIYGTDPSDPTSSIVL